MDDAPDDDASQDEVEQEIEFIAQAWLSQGSDEDIGRIGFLN